MLWMCRWRSRGVHGWSPHKIPTDVWLRQSNMLWDVYHTHRVPQKKEPVLHLPDLISFQNSFTSKKRTKFSIKFTRFFAPHPKMYPHYLRKVRSLNLFQSAIDWLKNVSLLIIFDKNETYKSCWAAGKILARLFEMSALCNHRHYCLTSLSITCWSRRFHLSQLIHIFEFSSYKPAAAPYLVIDRVEVWTIWKPQWRHDEVWCQALDQIDHLLYAMSRCRILLESEVIQELFDIRQKFLHE